MRRFILSAIFIILLIAVSGICQAQIAGVCSNCHTMHNSQGGSAEVQTYSGGSITTGVTTPQEYLLKASCIACHAGSTGKTNNFNAPIVVHTTAPSGQGGSYTLAGGDFYWVATGLGASAYGDAYGHNVSGLTSEDVTLGRTPPGWDTGATPGANNDGQIAGGEASWSSQLTCAGKYGCHGNHTETSPFHAIQRSHHSNANLTSTKADTDVSTVGKSYRFLSGIKGLEDNDWQWTESASDHNEYFGVDGNTDYANKNTTNYSCAECHGVFHKTIGGTSSPWLRHPTDTVLPNSGEYSNYNPDGSGAYSVLAPVARGAVPSSSSSTVIEGNTGETGAIVMCLSCHRAHGSSYYKLMRWDYKGATLSTALSGCNVCHTSKN